MKLEDIGFYTLEDSRAKNVSSHSPLWRCELILTDRCNFKCPYCMKLSPEYFKEISLPQAIEIVNLWVSDGLKNIRFSGGEPTLWEPLSYLVNYTKWAGVERIAISTNGSASFEKYEELYELGVNDFSISLDACCASTADKMAGTNSSYEKILNNIKELSKLTYVTVGVVLTKHNLLEAKNIIRLASSLGVADIRIISAAQWNSEEIKQLDVEDEILEKHPILKYRINNFRKGRNVRGIKESDSHKCPLVLDDMAVLGDYHFPCIIYMRQNGKAIGKTFGNFRQDRMEWYNNHNTQKDSICSRTCLDVCVDYNNKVEEIKR